MFLPLDRFLNLRDHTPFMALLFYDSLYTNFRCILHLSSRKGTVQISGNAFVEPFLGTT